MQRRKLLGAIGAMTLTGVATVAFSACYRDSAPPITNATPRGDQALALSCGVDDVQAPPFDGSPDGRLRSQTSGALSGPSGREWIGGPVPGYVPTKLGTLELFILDEADGGYFAFYRDPYGQGSCALSGATNCAYEARFYTRSKKLAWALRLGEVMSRQDHQEIQDIRLADGVLYFNEACQSYSGEARGQCSSLVAVEPRSKHVKWRTRGLISNGRFRLRGCYIVAGYGFTSEPDAVHLVDRGTGDVLQTVPVSSAPQQMTFHGREQLDVGLYSGLVRRYQLAGFDGAGARLVDLDPAEQIYGGTSYGGAGYGGAGYGGATYGGASYGGPPPRPRPRRP